MLFSVKNQRGPTLLVLVFLTGISLLIRAAFHLAWRLAPYPGLARDVTLGLGAILVSDGVIQSGLWLLAGDRYRSRFQALAEYFRPQRAGEIAGAGLLAGGEELFFRGVLLEGVSHRAGLGPAAGLAVSALAFGALHVIRDRRLAPFALWAVWEGVLLGGVYLAFGSLLTSMLVHALHDIIGFSLFAWQRSTGGRPSGRSPK